MSLKILTWNLSYAYGLGSEGGITYRQRPALHFQNAIDSFAELIINIEADIVLLQEVDFYSKRSCFTDQLAELSRKTGLLYRDAFVSWDSPYVPYPRLNPKNHFGKISSGGGILSRTPITRIQNDLLPKPRENGKLYNFFYLNRYIQIAESAGVKFANLHLEAFSRDNRELHLIKLQDRLRDYELDFAGGDFNGSIDLSEATQEKWTALPTPEPSFPAPSPDQYLDGFILKKNRFERTSVKTLNTGTSSDHFPVLLTLD